MDTVFNKKRRIQIAMRRYVIEGAPIKKHAHLFGISSKDFRKWLELQFSEEMKWSNYAEVWDLDHRVPVCYFNLDDPADLAAAYNFLNIQPHLINGNRNKAQRVDVHAYKYFFQIAGAITSSLIAMRLISKIDRIPQHMVELSPDQKDFLFKISKK